ncbi:MAG: polymer-forming cytoskeletal protein [Rectinema sp.]
MKGMKRLNFEPPEPYGTHIGSAVTMNGKLSSSLPLNLLCTFHGSLNGTFIRIDRNADVHTSTCTAQQMVIAGRFVGAMSVVDGVVILPNATVAADIKAADIQIAEGAIFEGSIETYDRNERH